MTENLQVPAYKRLLIYRVLRHYKHYLLELYKCTFNFITGIFHIVDGHNTDKLFGIQTQEHFIAEDTISLYKDGLMYAPTEYRPLKKILKFINPTREDVFVDFGCGMGRTVFFASRLNIKKAIGVELRKELFDECLRNLASFKFDKASIEFVNADASNYRIEDETLFFFFNPFGEKTFEKVIDNIKTSLILNPRKIRIVYHFPVSKKYLESQDWLVLETTLRSPDCMIWSNRFSEPRRPLS